MFIVLINGSIIQNSVIFAQDSTNVSDTLKTDVIDTLLFGKGDTVKTPFQETHTQDSTKKKTPIIAVLPDPSLDSNNIDFEIFTAVNYNRSQFKNTLFPFFDNSMFRMSVLTPISMFTYGRIKDKTYEENTGYLLAGALLINNAVTFTLKLTIKRQRVRVYIVRYGIYPRIITSVDPYSFPSGHTSNAFTIATMFALRYPTYPQVIFPMYAWAFFVGYGRMYLGMHYPSDVLTGALIGAGSSVLIHSLRKEFFKFKNNLLGEKKNDDGSINGGAISIFAAGFLASVAIDLILPKTTTTNKLTINASPFHNNNLGIGFNINYKF